MVIYVSNLVMYTICAVKVTNEEITHDHIIKVSHEAQREDCTGNQKLYFTYSEILVFQTKQHY